MFIILSFLFSLGVWEVWYIEVVRYMGEFMNSSFMNEWLKFIVWLGIVVLMFGLYGLSSIGFVSVVAPHSTSLCKSFDSSHCLR